MQPLYDNYNDVFCPICKKYVSHSDYLREAIPDKKTLWLANLITHYRHNHITSWNKCWGRNGGRYRHGWFGDYDNEKRKVNERAKRQLLRSHYHYMRFHKIGLVNFRQLQHNDPETLSLAAGLLESGQLNLF